MKQLLFTSLLLLTLYPAVSSQEGYIARNDSLRSAILDQNRKLTVFLPEGYENDSSRYPVLFLTDGEMRNYHIVTTVRFLNLNHKMPPLIIVGITNIDREHDFLPDSAAGYSTGGGAEKFVTFLKEELIPHIENNYRTEPFRVLAGHSFGGLFALYALLKYPELFNSYMALDPSCWYKDELIIKLSETEFSRRKNWSRSLFIAGREGDGMEEMRITSMERVLNNSAPADLAWKIKSYPDEDHGSVFFKSAYDGLRYIFDTGEALKVFPGSGIIPDGESFTVYLWNINPEMRYTTDGSEPGPDSPVCQTRLRLTGGCTLKIKNISRKYRNPPVATFTYRKGEYMKSTVSGAALKPGVKYEYYEGAWDSLPDFSRLRPVTRGITGKIDLTPALRKDSCALRFEGYLHIREKGLYSFWIMSDDDSRFLLNRQLILENEGLHTAFLPQVALIPLLPGYFPVQVEYFELTENEVLSAGMVKGDDNPSPAPFPEELLFHKK